MATDTKVKTLRDGSRQERDEEPITAKEKRRNQEETINDSRNKFREEKTAKLRDRLLYILDDLAPSRGKYAYLERRTGIPSSRWQNLYLEKQLPTLDMLLAIMEYRRDYMHWILTGLDIAQDETPRTPKPQEWATFLEHREWLRKAKEKKNDDQES